MKKTIGLAALLLLLVCVLGACSGTPGAKDDPTGTTASTASAASKQNVTVTVSAANFAADFDETAFYAQLDAIAGLSHTKNENGDYVLQMTEDAYRKLREVKAKEVVDAFRKSEEDPSSYVQRVEYDEDFRTLRVFIDRAAYQALTAETGAGMDLTSIGLAASCNAYQLFTKEGPKVHVKLIYSDDETTAFEFTQPIVLT